MKKRAIVSVALSCFFPSLSSSAENDSFSFLNWGAYVAPDEITAMAEEFGWEVQEVTYENSDKAESLLLAGGSGFDVAVVATETLGRLVSAGALQEVSSFEFSGRAELEQGLWPLLLEALPVAEKYAVPYAWGTLGLAFDINEVRARLPDVALDSWSLIFDPQNAAALADCGISIVDSNEEVVAAALTYLGRNPQSVLQQDLDAAFEVLESIAPFVQSYDTFQHDALIDGRACLSISWSSEAFEPDLKTALPHIKYVLPKEGSNLWADLFVLPADAPSPQKGVKMINRFSHVDVMAANAKFTFSVARSADVRALIQSPYYSHSALTLPDEVLKNLYVVHARDGAGKRLLDQRWHKMQLGIRQ
ncbi:extracellular solute-binding protein [Shimia sp. R11_0]|uniref:extracellular solute-binding protein n=1 Tax=Shimia sp. R11_0 TaxID=2821096 RepID=UPI001AD970A1|nr:extracellular solute-binding protein [Shimia sp. R11_0]MBO9477285.1 extracellular solute-binding protein [Shimia sp. R11_0]